LKGERNVQTDYHLCHLGGFCYWCIVMLQALQEGGQWLPEKGRACRPVRIARKEVIRNFCLIYLSQHLCMAEKSAGGVLCF
jgi:hypothetical protein